jgi:hypothetical protein
VWLSRYGRAGVPHHLRVAQAECVVRLASAQADPDWDAAVDAAVGLVSADASPTRRSVIVVDLLCICSPAPQPIA